MTSPSEPQRRCVGCGRSAAKAELLRLTAVGGLAVPDPPTGQRPGRGAYICRGASAAVQPACLDRATRRGGLARAFREPVRIAPGALDGDRLVHTCADNGTCAANHLESID